MCVWTVARGPMVRTQTVKIVQYSPSLGSLKGGQKLWERSIFQSITNPKIQLIEIHNKMRFFLIALAAFAFVLAFVCASKRLCPILLDKAIKVFNFQMMPPTKCQQYHLSA